MDKKFCVYETYKVPWPLHNYIGKTSVDKINNGYMGSGVLINKAINKHGVKNFHTKILEEFENEDDAYNAEVNYISLKNPYYNIHPGGHICSWSSNSSIYDVDTLVEKEKNRTNISTSISIDWLYNDNLSLYAKLFYIFLNSRENNRCELPRTATGQLLGLSLYQLRAAISELTSLGAIKTITRRQGLTDIIEVTDITKNNDAAVGETIAGLEEENIRLQEIIWEITQKAAQAFKKSKD